MKFWISCTVVSLEQSSKINTSSIGRSCFRSDSNCLIIYFSPFYVDITTDVFIILLSPIDDFALNELRIISPPENINVISAIKLEPF